MPLYAILAALTVALCWGGNFTATKFALQDLPPILTILVRFIVVDLLLLPFALRLPRPRMRDMLVIGVALIVGQFILMFTAMALGLTITSAIIGMQMGVPFACLMSAIVFKDYLGPWRSLGLLLAFSGVLVVAGTPNAAQHPGAFLLAITAAFSWSVANVYMKRIPKLPVITLLFWPGLMATPFLFLLSALLEHGQLAAIAHAHTSTWVGLTYSTFISFLLGYGLWNWLVTHFRLTQVVPFSLCTPVVGIIIGAWFFGEPITLRIILGAVMTIIGVGIISLRRPQLAEAEST